MDVAPIIRGEFQYRDVLLVDCGGELKRHPRASEADIRRQLNGKDAKDQVGHWWEAQVIHYGLRRSKQKDACKVRLQQALNQGKLKVQPPHLADMEAQMKKEYVAAIRKASRQSKSSTPAPVNGMKRPRDEESDQISKKTKVTVKVGGVSVATEEFSSDKQQFGYSSSPSQWAGDPRDHPDNVFQRSSSSRTIEPPKATPKVKKAKVEQGFATDIPKAKPMPKKAKAEIIQAKKHVKEEPTYQEEDNEMDMRPDISQDQLNITGVYNLSCPELALQAPDHADKFRLFMCVDNDAGRIWGAFELAWKSGHIKVDNIAYNMELTLGWRARDFEIKGGLRFGEACFGNIEFFGREQVRGTLYNLFPEALEFEGTRRPGPLWCGRSAYKFQQEWDEYPKEAYGR